MRKQLRWVIFELVKLSIVLALFGFVQERVIDSREQSFLQTSNLAEAQTRQIDRLLELQLENEALTREIASSSSSLRVLRSELDAQHQLRSSDQTEVRQLIDDRDDQLRSLIESGFERIETATYSTTQEAESVVDRVDQLERSIEREPNRMKERMIYPVVQLRGNGTVGSGVVVHSARNSETGEVETYILTAYHVVLEILEGAPGSRIVDDLRFLDPRTDQLVDEPVTARLEAFHETADIALISTTLDEPWPYVATIAAPKTIRKMTIFDSVYAVGCPLGNKPMPTAGEVSSQDKLVEGEAFWMINAPTFFGNSGGGVYKSETGELVGISSMIYTYGKSQPMVVPHMGLFIPMESIREWLRECSEATAKRTFDRVFARFEVEKSRVQTVGAQVDEE